MSVVFKVKGLQVSVAAVCTRIGSYAAKGREGTRWQGDMWARGVNERHRGPEAQWTRPMHRFGWPVAGGLAQRETGDRINSLGNMPAAFVPVSGLPL